MNLKKVIAFIVVIAILLGVLIFLIFFKDGTAKNKKIGNNSTSQEIVDYILNMNSYEAVVEVEIQSNKNENKYKIKQKYNGEQDNKQEVLEPSNIEGVRIIKEGNTLKLENTDLNLTTVIENYEGVTDNSLDLSSFIKDYKQDGKSSWEEKNNSIIMKTSSQDQKISKKILYISKETGKPQKMEIQDTNKKTVIYIQYNEVTVNS